MSVIKYHIDKFPVFRSARPYMPVIINPPMTKEVLWVDKNPPHNVYDNPYTYPDLFERIEVSASDYIEGYEPYKAFQMDESSNGWLATIQEPVMGNEPYPWIRLDAGDWNWRSPQDAIWPFAITKVEVINHNKKSNICKQFDFQAWTGSEWKKIRTCKIIKDDPYPTEVESLPPATFEWTDYILRIRGNTMWYYHCVKDNSGNYYWSPTLKKPKYRSVFEIKYPEDSRTTYYKQFRLQVRVVNGTERTGFKCINMYTFKDHDQITWGSDNVKNRNWPHFYEKIFIQNDDCDGIVWEKIHDSTMLFAVTSWYPGFYGSTNYHVGVIHPNDTIIAKRPGDEIYHAVSNGPFVLGADSWFLYPGEYICRTKDYVVCRIGDYYSGANTIRYSANGKEWTKWFSVPNEFWRGAAGGFGLKDNIGMCFNDGKVYSLELADWDVKITQIGKIGEGGIVANGGYVGDISMQGTALGEHGLQYHKFLNTNGELYTSKLQSEYQYTDMRESDPTKRVKTTGCNWSFFYANGWYCAAQKHIKIIYWNEVKQEWQTESKFTFLKSKDGFRTYTSDVLDPCPDYRYRSFSFGAIGNTVEIIEQYVELDGNLQPTNWYHTLIGGKATPDYIDVPMIGFNSDPLYRSVRIRFSNKNTDPSEESKIALRDFSPGIPIYVENGKINEDVKYWVIPTAFKHNGWSSNAYDEGGYVVLNDKLESKFAFGTSNYMIDQHNFTYSNILL